MLNCELKISEEKEPLISGGDGKSGTGSAVGSEHSDSDDDWEGVESTDLDEIFSAATAFVAAKLGKIKGYFVLPIKAALQIFDEGPPFTLQRICEVSFTMITSFVVYTSIFPNFNPLIYEFTFGGRAEGVPEDEEQKSDGREEE
ncbi:hypothetical protein ACS0TY_010589 [Phlomoides rotata]